MEAPSPSNASGSISLSPEERLYLLGYQGVFYRTATPTSIKIPSENIPVSVRVAPNPFTEFIQFEFSAEDIPLGSQLTVYNVTGTCIATRQMDIFPYVFNACEMMDGLYFYQIQTPSGEMISGKIEKVAKR